MNQPWQYQLRVYLADDLAGVARSDGSDPALKPLTDILNQHKATLVSQFDAFENYVAQAEREGPENYPLYRWTKSTLEDPAKRSKHSKTFAIRISGDEVYSKEAADALEADLRLIVGGTLVARISRHDTNPANNLPVPPEYRS
jgi:hypothetical protein